MKKIIATLLAVCMLLSCLSVVTFVSAEEIEVWDGKAISTYAGGTGVVSDPYLIENGGQLYNAIKTLGKNSSGKALYYKVTKDIYLNENYENYSNWMLEDQAPANNWSGVNGGGTFIGHIDGGYNTVYGLWYSKSDSRVGLIPYMNSGATLSNLYVANAYVRTGYDTNGIICGRLGNATISNVVVYDSIIYNRNGGTPNLGAVVGWADVAGATIKNCAVYDMSIAYADVATGVNAGGIIGKATKLINVSNCFSANVDVYKTNSGTDNGTYVRKAYIFGNTGYINCTNSHTDISGSKNGVTHWNTNLDGMKGSGAVANMKLSAKVWKDTEDSYPTFVAYDNTNEGVKGQVWTGMVASKFAGGEGTEASPFIIETAEQLYKASMDNGLRPSGGAAYYLITADIYLNDGYANYATWNTTAPANNWLSNSGDFMGHIDGGLHTIYGLYSNRNAWCNGLIASLGNGASISNLIIANSYVYSATNTVGAIVGLMKENTTITKCIVRDTVVASVGADLGGIAGAIKTYTSTISNCGTYNLTVTGSGACGGIVGRCWGNTTNANSKIQSSYSVGNVPLGDTNKLSVTGVYTDISGTKNGVTVVDNSKMKGEGAVANMGLSNIIWKDTETYPAFALDNGVKGQVWTGATAFGFAGGDGTQAAPYLIETAEQLFKAVSELGKKGSNAAYYLIIADIYINADYENYATWGETAPANNWLPTRGDFIGHIDGGFHTVYGLYTKTGSWRNGLIPYMNSGATITNLNVAYAYVRNGDSTAGAIVGAMYNNTKISKSLVHDVVLSTGSTTAGDVGGIVGAVTTNTSTISNCGTYNITLDVAAAINAGGLVGRVWTAPSGANGTRIYNCYSVGHHPLGNQGACWTDYNYSDIEGTKAGFAVVAAADMLGDAAATSMQYLDFINTWATVENGYPVLRANANNNLNQAITASYAIDDNGKAAVKFTSKVDMPALNPTYNTNIAITVNGVKKIVSETGIIISRAGIDVTDVATVENTPLTGYKVVCYTNGGKENSVIIKGGYTLATALVYGTVDYVAKSYMIFDDGSVAMSDAYTTAPSTEETTIDGVVINDTFKKGDANLDGAINVLDLVRTKKYAASEDFNGAVVADILDFDGDGAFAAIDIAGLRKLLIESEADAPSEEMELVFEENFTQLP